MGIIFSIFAASLAAFVVFVHPSLAEDGYSAQETVRSYSSINLKPGAAITFEIHFKNRGTETWSRTGDHFVELVTVDPEKRASDFAHTSWDQNWRPSFLGESQVAPGGIGTFKFALLAPQKEGKYEETFQAVAKDMAWIDGTKFTIPINVVSELPKPVVQDQTTTTQADATFSIPEDYPVQDPEFAAKWVGGPQLVITAEPGAQILKTIDVANIGSKTWTNSGSHAVSAYTVRENYHASPFSSNGPGWMNDHQLRLSSEVVSPGDTGHLSVLLQAPKTPGKYTDHIRLAAENHTWMKDGELEIEIDVTGTVPSDQQTDATDNSSAIYKDTTYAATYLISSGKELSMQPGQTISFQVGFKNTGEKIWRNSGSHFISMYTILPNYRASRFATSTAAASAVNQGWIASNQVALSQDQVNPGQIAYFRFDLTAPSTMGDYTENFRLAAEDYTWIQGGEFSLPIHVQNGIGTLPVENNNPPAAGSLGPIMRVGIVSSDSPFSVTADTPFDVRTTGGEILGSLAAGTEVQITYDGTNKTYTVRSSSVNTTTSQPVIVHALDDSTIMEILSLERRLSWNPAVNENLFRGSIEINHSDTTGKTWAIDILPMEYYLRGLAETSSASPVEFLKVMSVVGRTYAMYHYQHQTKHADEHFYVDSDYDQVYRGYAIEKADAPLVEAVNATRGEAVTWTNPDTSETKIAITPYFSQSDGRTRDWSEVWGGDVAWAKSVPVPEDNGKQLLGHGVGLSARGALLMVLNEGKTYDQVLHYFFQDIVIAPQY